MNAESSYRKALKALRIGALVALFLALAAAIGYFAYGFYLHNQGGAVSLNELWVFALLLSLVILFTLIVYFRRDPILSNCAFLLTSLLSLASAILFILRWRYPGNPAWANLALTVGASFLAVVLFLSNGFPLARLFDKGFPEWSLLLFYGVEVLLWLFVLVVVVFVKNPVAFLYVFAFIPLRSGEYLLLSLNDPLTRE